MTWLSTLLGVLFIGHSLFGPTNPQMLAQMLQIRAPETQVDAQIINGAPLKWNWSNSVDGEGVDARAVLPSGRYGTVILTEAIPLANHMKWNDSNGYALKFYRLATRSRRDARVYLQETWHSLNSGTGVAVPDDAGADIPWRDRLDRDLAAWQDIVTFVNAASDGDSPDMALIPAGQAMARLYDEIAAGTVPGLSDIGDVFADDIHPNDIGFYFLTMVQYATLTGETPVGLPYRLKDRWGKPFKAPESALARRLQGIAWASVQDYLAAIPTVAMATIRPDTPEPPRLVAAPVIPAPPLPAKNPSGPVPLAIGLAEVTDWSPQQPFLDLMKTARPWIGHKRGQWGGAEYGDLLQSGVLDANGWPTTIPSGIRSIGTLILTDMPKQAGTLAGRYVLRFDGKGIVEVAGRATKVRYGDGMVRFDYTPGPGSVDIRIQRSGRAGDYVRNITVVRQDRLQAFDAGARFNPDWLARLDGFGVLRFMDWMQTNNSPQTRWDDRPRPDDFTYALNGVPAEVMIALANRVGADAWFNMPHMADDAYVSQFAALVRDRLAAGRKAYAEYSNEVWNWQFAQAGWADEQAKARWGAKDAWMQFYGMRAAQMAQIWSKVFGNQAGARLVNVISSQTGWMGLEEQVLQAPLWVAQTPGGKPPAAYFDAYGVTGYFGGILGTSARAPMVRQWISDSRKAAFRQGDAQGLSGAEHRAYVKAHQYDAASAMAARELRDGSLSGDVSDTLAGLLGTTLPYHAKVADQYGLRLIMYEGGSHVVGIGPMVDDADLSDFFIQFNYSAEMGALYRELILGWDNLGGTLFNAYSDVYRPSKWGSWGALRYLSDDNPRWDALVAFQ
jgi:hypothetical protein